MNIEEFSLVDQVVAWQAEPARLVTRAGVPKQGKLFEAHFPGLPLMPGTLQTEAMAQTAGLLLMARYRFERMPFLVAIDRARFRTRLEPGCEVQITASLLYDNGLLGSCWCTLEAHGKKVSEAEVRLSVATTAEDGLGQYVSELAARVGLDSVTSEFGTR